MSLIPAFEIGLWNAWIFIVWYLGVSIVTMLNKDVKKRGTMSDLPYNNIVKFLEQYIATTFWFLSIIYTIFLPLKLGTAWFYVGLPLCLIGLIMLTVAKINFATTPLDKPITKGLYKISRHPIYVAHDFIFIGIGIACASWVFLLLSIIYFTSQHLSAIPEERFCLEKYGESYREYMNEVSRYLGRRKA